MLSLVACLAISVPLQDRQDNRAQGTVSIEREIGVHNYLITRFHLLKRGQGVDGVRAEITGEIDLTGLSHESLELLKSTLSICNSAASNNAATEARIQALNQEEADRDAGALVQLLGALYTGGASLAATHSTLELLATNDQELAQLESAQLELIRAEVAQVEFELAQFRSRLQSEGKVASDQLLRSVDYDHYIRALALDDPGQQLAAVATAHARSPGLQPASLYLANHHESVGQILEARRLALLSLGSSPVILRRDPLRVAACFTLARMSLREDPAEAAEWTTRGLDEDPASVPLLSIRAQALMELKDHSGVYPVFRQLSLLDPGSGWVLYNLACCQAVVDEDARAAYSTFAASIEAGFNSIAHARQDPDLTIVRTQLAEEWERLLAPRISVGVNQAFLSNDSLVLRNDGSYALTNLDVTVHLDVNTRDRRTREIGIRTVQVGAKALRLDPGGHVAVADVSSFSTPDIVSARIRGSSSEGKIDLEAELIRPR